MPGYAFKKQVGLIGQLSVSDVLCHSKTNARLGQLYVSGFWPAFLCLFGCMDYFSLTACDCSVILSHNKLKNCRPCFQKKKKLSYPGHRGPTSLK